MIPNQPKIILASKSPRRKELLETLGINFKLHPSTYDEGKNHESPQKTAQMHAIMKARNVAQYYKDEIIIGVDTIGTYKNRILGKPKDRTEAKEMLKFLNGSTHEVISGICLIDTKNNKEVSSTVITEVTFEKMTNQEIENYLASGEGDDKAASYAIQGRGALFVRKISGDYFNVVGLPINELYRLLKKLGVRLT